MVIEPYNQKLLIGVIKTSNKNFREVQGGGRRQKDYNRNKKTGQAGKNQGRFSPV